MHDDLSRVANGFRCRRCDGTIQEAALHEDLMVCKEFLLFRRFSLDGNGADLAATYRIKMDGYKVPRASQQHF